MGKILIIPDVHGREFWKEPCKNIDDYEKIIFLGDYVAPYLHEGISDKTALETFKEILEFKKVNKDKVVLLLGNHDFTYFQTWICECRTDYYNIEELRKLYKDNLDLFDIAWETEINNNRYFLSHAGVKKKWMRKYVNNILFVWNENTLPKVDMFNNAFHVAYKENNDSLRDRFELAISICSYYRGNIYETCGSIVWADAREFLKEPREYDNVIFICGHTQSKNEPILTEGFVDLDVRKAFTLDTESGKIEEFTEN